jgi:hypothetical protein
MKDDNRQDTQENEKINDQEHIEEVGDVEDIINRELSLLSNEEIDV